MFLSKLKKPSTYLKYLLSYILVFLVLMAAFFLILRVQLAETYRTQRTIRIQCQMEALRDHLREEFFLLSQIDSLLTEDPEIKLATYKSEGKYIRPTINELHEYAGSSDLINYIVYCSHYNGYVFSPPEYVSYTDGIFTFVNTAGKRTQFDTAPYMDCASGQLLWQEDGQAEYLIYFPPNRSEAKYIYFYVLDTRTIQSQLKGMLSDEVPAVALLDTRGRYVTGFGFDAYTSEIAGKSPTPGIQPLSKNFSMFLSGEIYSGFSLAAVVSEDYLASQVDTAFLRSFLSLLGLSMVGIGVVYLAMLFTYRPLHRFVNTVIREPGENKNYLDMLQNKYSSLNDHNLQLQESLAGYRDFARKNILGSLLTQQYSLNPVALDQIFDNISRTQKLMTVKVSKSRDNALPDRVARQLKSAVDGSCFVLQVDQTGTIFLVLLGAQADRTQVLEAAQKLHEEWDLCFAFSESSDSVMDIPLLLKNVETASQRWPQEYLAEFRETEPDPLNYPNEALNQLPLLLKGNQFDAARKLIESLLVSSDDAPEYFISSIILDCLTIITNSMNQAHIEFETYRGVFTEAVNQCRNIYYIQNYDTLKSLINELLFFYEQEIVSRSIRITPLRQMVESNFCDPNFSISTIAETYHVSISWISMLFKEEMGIGFADYIWKLRLEKAQSFLRDTEMSVEEISSMVGYLTSSSFGRKFKQETGMTPSQYRSKFAASSYADQGQNHNLQNQPRK